MEKISLDELKKLCKPEIDALADRIESIAMERGAYIVESWLRNLIEDLIENVHIEKFVINALAKYSRKFKLWFKRKF